MALQTSNISLEERFSKVDGNTTEQLRFALCNASVRNVVYKHPETGKNLYAPYLRLDLAYAIVKYFSDRGIPFGRPKPEEKDPGEIIVSDEETFTEEEKNRGYLAAETTLNNSDGNKEAFKPVELGMRLDGIPKEFIAALTDWEKLYFFAGIVEGEKAHEKTPCMDAYEIASYYIRKGIEIMEDRHNKFTDKKPATVFAGDGRPKIVYKNTWDAPEKKRINKQTLAIDKIADRMDLRYWGYAIKLLQLYREKKSATPMAIFGERTPSEVESAIDSFLGSMEAPALRYLQSYVPWERRITGGRVVINRTGFEPEELRGYASKYQLPKPHNFGLKLNLGKEDLKGTTQK